jgi:hypothetical protein
MDVNDVASPFAVTYEKIQVRDRCLSDIVFIIGPRHERLYTRRVQETGVTPRPVYIAACYLRLSAVCSRV